MSMQKAFIYYTGGTTHPGGYAKRTECAFSLNVPKTITENRKDGSGTHRHPCVNGERKSPLSKNGFTRTRKGTDSKMHAPVSAEDVYLY